MSQVGVARGEAPADPAASRPRLVVVSAVGVAQILAWGSSYYLPAVLAGPIAADTGWPLGWVVGALSGGLLVSGLVSPRVGHVIERHGGRPVLATSAVLLALGLLGLGLAPGLPFFIAAWLVIGFGMGCGLYDPAFSALGIPYGETARASITHVTLFGGFASTVCWPLAHPLHRARDRAPGDVRPRGLRHPHGTPGAADAARHGRGADDRDVAAGMGRPDRDARRPLRGGAAARRARAAPGADGAQVASAGLTPFEPRIRAVGWVP
jgi:hypothetical protein